MIRDQKCAKKISPTPLQHLHHQFIQGRMDPCFHVVYAKFWPERLDVAAEMETCQIRQSFFDLLLSNFGWTIVNWSLSFLLVAGGCGTECGPLKPIWFTVRCVGRWHSVWSSEAHLIHGAMCQAFTDGLLHTLVVTRDYLSYSFLSIISNQSGHSPEICCFIIFLFLWDRSLERVMCEKSN